MFEISYSQITNPALTNAFERLMAHKGFSTKVAYNIARIADKLDQASKKIREEKIIEEYTSLAKGHGIIDLKGVPVKDLSQEKQDSWRDLHEAFDKKTFKIDRHKIQVSDIEPVGLTPQELFAIADFVEGLEGGENAKKQKSFKEENFQEVTQ